MKYNRLMIALAVFGTLAAPARAQPTDPDDEDTQEQAAPQDDQGSVGEFDSAGDPSVLNTSRPQKKYQPPPRQCQYPNGTIGPCS